jgi:mono/diheme cytochrome c family protein
MDFTANTYGIRRQTMITKLSALLLTLSITLVLTACGSDNAVESSANPQISPITESPTPVSTQAKETSTPKAAPTATVKPIPTPTPIPTTKPTTKPTETPKALDTNSEAAQALFKQSCTSCHGVDLGGDFGPNLQKVGGKLTKEQITTQITDGGTEMPPFSKSLKKEEIAALAAWLSAKK